MSDFQASASIAATTSAGIDSLRNKLAEDAILQSSLEQLGRERKQLLFKPRVMLFFSFDIVNSTAFKATINQWPTVLSHIFDRINHHVAEAISNVEVWRILGDEIVFIVQISELENLYEYVDRIFFVLQEICDEIRKGSLFERRQDLIPYAKQLQQILSLKAAAWIARITSTDGTNCKHRADCIHCTKCHNFHSCASHKSFGSAVDDFKDNVITEYPLDRNRSIVEFLGNDIDEGFRLSKMVARRRMVVSFTLAYLLSEKTQYLQRLIIISYESMKGIWQDRPYPIIWYHDPHHCNEVAFEDSFYYDEAGDEKLSRKYFLNRQENPENPFPVPSIQMYTDTRTALTKICDDLLLQGKIERIRQTIKCSDDSEKCISLSPDTFDLDCVAVCFSSDGKNVLVARHADSPQRNNSNKWYFGGHYISKDSTIASELPQLYENDFGIKIQLLLDDVRHTPKPLGLYESVYQGLSHKGILTVAKITENGSRDNLILQTSNRNKEVQLMSIEEAMSLDENETVPNFQHTLKEAQAMFDMWTNHHPEDI